MIDLDYYDKILVGIGGSILGGVIVGFLTSIALHFGVLLGTLVATLFVYDVLFRNPPLPATHPRVAAVAFVWHVLLFAVALAVYVE